MSSPSMLRVAAAQYSVDYLTSLDQLREKLARWVAEAAAQGAKLLVFPEFSGMEIAALGDRRAAFDRRSPAGTRLDLCRSLLPAVMSKPCNGKPRPSNRCCPNFFRFIRSWRRVMVSAFSPGAFRCAGARTNYVTAPIFFAADGTLGYQDKNGAHRWEREY
jgi:predicted amidohydrolase